MSAVIFTKDNCSFCVRAKDLMKVKGISYDEYILDVYGKDDRTLTENQSWATLEELRAKNPFAKTVPQIWLDGEYVGGFTELNELLKS